MEGNQPTVEPVFVPPAGAVIPSSNWTGFRDLPSIDIRNGDPSSIVPILMNAMIPTAYHWVPVPVENTADAGKLVDGYIRSHLVHLSDNQPANCNASQIRKAAIVLGTVRAMSQSVYRMNAKEFIPGEVRAPLLGATVAADGTVTYNQVPGYAGAHPQLLTEPLNFSETELAVICQITKCAVGVIPMQGYSLLMMTNHHYLSAGDSQSTKVFAVAEKAYWKSNDVASWFNDDLTMIQDWMWHKATHPVALNVKTSSAMDPTIVAKLTAAGASACASRLPAVESELRAANSYITLFSTVNPMFRMFGGNINFAQMVELVGAIKAMAPGVVAPAVMPVLPPAYASVITNRVTGLQVLGDMLKRNADNAALCFGFYTAYSDSKITLEGTVAETQDTLKSSFSLTKLKQQSYASYVTGVQLFGDYQAARNQRRQASPRT